MGREDDDVKVDNVICRTPARNAQNLELVKTEILDMVDRAVSDPPINLTSSSVLTSINSTLNSRHKLCMSTACTTDN